MFQSITEYTNMYYCTSACLAFSELAVAAFACACELNVRYKHDIRREWIMKPWCKQLWSVITWLGYMPFFLIEQQAREIKAETGLPRSEYNSMVGRTYPSLSFSRLAIDLVKPVKQVSIKRVFPGGRLIRWKIITNSALNLKKKMEALVDS